MWSDDGNKGDKTVSRLIYNCNTRGRFCIFNGEAYEWDPEQNKYVTVDPATLPESLTDLIALSAETGIEVH